MVTSLQDEILVSTRTGGGEGVLACAVTGSLAGDGDLHGQRVPFEHLTHTST